MAAFLSFAALLLNPGNIIIYGITKGSFTSSIFNQGQVPQIKTCYLFSSELSPEIGWIYYSSFFIVLKYYTVIPSRYKSRWSYIVIVGSVMLTRLTLQLITCVNCVGLALFNHSNFNGDETIIISISSCYASLEIQC